MSTVDLIEQWLEKCDLAHQAQTRYDRDPTPTNYSRLKRAQEERGAANGSVGGGVGVSFIG